MAGGWQDYSEADNRRLNEAFATYSGSVAGVKAREVELEGGWCVSLEEMRQFRRREPWKKWRVRPPQHLRSQGRRSLGGSATPARGGTQPAMGRSPPIGGATPSPLPATPGQAEPAPSTTAEAEELADELGVFFALGPSLDAGDEVARQLKMRQGAMNELVSTETRCAPRPACAAFNADLWLQDISVTQSRMTFPLP